MLRPTPGDPWGVEQHHWSKRKQTVEPRWAKHQTNSQQSIARKNSSDGKIEYIMVSMLIVLLDVW